VNGFIGCVGDVVDVVLAAEVLGGGVVMGGYYWEGRG